MPRRRVLTEAQLHALLALPTAETELIRHYTLSPADLAVIYRRRQPHNRLGFALQLCAFRYPGRIVKPGEIVPMEVVTFLAEQLGLDPDSLADYATRAPTRYDHLDALRATFGFHTLSQPDRAALAVFLRPVALATTSGVRVAEALMAELRQRGVAAPGPTVIERLAATALLEAERHAADTLNRRLSAGQRAELDALLRIHPGTAVSALAWARQPAGAPGARSLSRLVEQIDILRRIGIDPDLADGVHADRVKQLAREGARLTGPASQDARPGASPGHPSGDGA